MKYDMTARVYGLVFRRILGSYYKKHVPEMSASKRRAVFRRIQEEYKAMLERTPGVGGKENSLEEDLIGACWFFALAKADPDMSPERMDDVIVSGIQSNFMQKSHRKERENGTLFSDKVQDKKLREAERSQHSKYEMDWKFTYEKGEDEFYCTYTECGICKLAQREHTEAWLPCLCRMDYGTYDMVGAELIRTKTLAAGDECCNFHVIRKKG